MSAGSNDEEDDEEVIFESCFRRVCHLGVNVECCPTAAQKKTLSIQPSFEKY